MVVEGRLDSLRDSPSVGESLWVKRESIEQIFSGEADFGKKVTCTISRNGDLINQVFLEVELPALQTSYLEDPTGGTGDYAQLAYTNAIGHALILNVQVDIGGQQIDKQYGVWLEIWDKAFCP